MLLKRFRWQLSGRLPRLFVFGHTLPTPPKRSSSKVLDLSPESPQGFANAKSRLAWSVLSHSLCSGQLVPVAPPGPSPSPRSQTHSFGTRGFTERSAACCGRVGKWQRSSLSLFSGSSLLWAPLSALALSHSSSPSNSSSLYSVRIFRVTHSSLASRPPELDFQPLRLAIYSRLLPARAPLSSRRFFLAHHHHCAPVKRAFRDDRHIFTLDTHTVFGFPFQQHREPV